MTRDQIVDLVIDLSVNEALERLVQELPFLGFKFINPIAEYFVKKVVVVLFTQGRMLVNERIIDYNLKKEAGRLNEASDKARRAVATGDKDAIEKSNQEIIDAARDLIRFGRDFV